MARFTLTIDTGNAAFHGDGPDGEEDFQPAGELQRILQIVAREAGNGVTHGYALDVNGNRVGEYQLGEDPPPVRATRGAVQTGAGHIHPESLRTLRGLVELHGLTRIRAALGGLK